MTEVAEPARLPGGDATIAMPISKMGSEMVPFIQETVKSCLEFAVRGLFKASIDRTLPVVELSQGLTISVGPTSGLQSPSLTAAAATSFVISPIRGESACFATL